MINYFIRRSIFFVIALTSSILFCFFENPVGNFNSISYFGTEYMSAFKTALFSFCCQYNTLGVYSNLASNSYLNISLFSIFSSFGGVFISSLIGFIGAGIFHCNSSSDICTSLIDNKLFSRKTALSCAISFCAFLLTGTISFVYFLCNTVENTLKSNKILIDRQLLSGLIGIAVGILSITFDPNKILGIISATFISLISLILPSLFYLIIVRKGQLFIRILGIIVLMIGLTSLAYFNIFK